MPQDVLARLWNSDEGAAGEMLEELRELSLVFVDADGCVHLHDLQRDCLRVDAGEEALPAMNGALIDAYGKQCGDAGVPGLSRAWWALPGGSYMLDHLCFHLAEAGRVAELRSLLCSFRWIRRRIEASGYAFPLLQRDFPQAGRAAPQNKQWMQ